MSSRSIYFLGITTGGSAVRIVFPAWMDLLGVDAALKTVDIPAGSPAEPYRDFVAHVREDPAALGAVITAHKTAVFAHAEDLLSAVDPVSKRFEEVSVLHRVEDGLGGTVIEHLSIATTLTQMGNGVPITRRERDLVVFGAGGTTVSLIATLTDSQWPDEYRPRRLHLVDLSAERLTHARALASSGDKPLNVEIHQSHGHFSLQSLGKLPDGTLIVNATGLGKDRPGSPFALPATWPQDAHVWDLNYRGNLVMLQEAKTSASQYNLHPHDGWFLFINGWAESLARIIGRPIDDQARQRMDELARPGRS